MNLVAPFSMFTQENPQVAIGAKASLPGNGTQVSVSPVSVSSVFLGMISLSQDK